MRPNTAVCLVLSGAALLLLAPEAPARRRLWSGRALALVVLVLGLATLAEHSLGVDLGVGHILPFGDRSGIPAGGGFLQRSSPSTSLGVVFASASLIALDGRSRLLARAHEIGAMAAGFIGFVSLIAHAYGAVSLYPLPMHPATGVALHTALALTLLGAALLCARPERGALALVTSDDAGGFAARRLLPAAVGAPFALGFLVLTAYRAGLLYGPPAALTLLVASSATIAGVIVLITAGALDRAAFAQRTIEDEVLRLRPEQARLSALVASSDDGILTTTPDGVVVTWNAACERMYGYSAEEMIGRPITILTPPERLEELHVLLAQLRRGERGKSLETSRVRKDGSRLEVDLTTLPIHDVEGRLTWILAMARDIGARKEAEREIALAHERERRLRAQLEALGRASEAITDAVADLPETEVNAVLQTVVLQARAITGARYAALGIGNDPERPFHPWVWSGMSPHDAEAIGRFPRPIGLLGVVACQGRAVRLRSIANDPEGVGFPAGHPPMTSFLGVPIWYRGRSVGNLYLADKHQADEFTADDQRAAEMLALHAGTALETARIYSEEALAKKWLQSVIDGMPECVLLADSSGRVSYNPAALALACDAAGGEDGAGAPLRLDLRRPTGERLSWREQPLARALHEGDTMTGVELTLHCGMNRILPVLVSASPVHDRALRTVGAVCVLRDVTGLKQLEQLREEWTAVVAHDLRQPLTTISMAAAVLAQLPLDTDDPRAAKAIDRIRGATARLVAMIGDLLDTSRLEAQRLTLRRELTDVPRLIRDIVDRVDEAPGGRRVVVRVNGEPAKASIDPERLEQVLANLLSNAAKYGAPGTDIEVDIAERAFAIEISVTNRGAGLGPEEQAKLFTRFYRAQPEGPARGLGLGLYIAKGLVEAHGGRIWVESIPGAATSFHFTVPLSALEPRCREERPDTAA